MNFKVVTWSPKILKSVESYKSYLAEKYGKSVVRKFTLQYNSNPEAAISEALVFYWLRQMNFNPAVNETLDEGGVDFICTLDESHQFLVEVTCLGVDALTKQTGLGFVPGQPAWYNSSTKMMRQRVSDKARQFGNAPMPRIVIITTLHELGSLLLSTDEAVSFFVSDWGWTIETGSGKETYKSTELKESIFFGMSKDRTKLEVKRQSISAILLMPIFGDSVNVVGILHPDPTYPLDTAIFPKIPFLKIKDWSLTMEVLHPEWNVADPIPPNYKMVN